MYFAVPSVKCFVFTAILISKGNIVLTPKVEQVYHEFSVDLSEGNFPLQRNNF